MRGAVCTEPVVYLALVDSRYCTTKLGVEGKRNTNVHFLAVYTEMYFAGLTFGLITKTF